MIFDTDYYLKRYPDVAQAGGEALTHFITHGLKEVRYPCARLEAECRLHPNPETNLQDVSFYRERYPLVRAFVTEFPTMTEGEFFRTYGRFMGHLCRADDPLRSIHDKLDGNASKAYNFDPVYYSERYGRDLYYPFDDYQTTGAALQHSPTQWFDEKFYQAFYPDVYAAVVAQKLASGFEHYLQSGAREGRLARHDLGACLEVYYHGITRSMTAGLLNLFEDWLNHPPLTIEPANEPVVWLMLETFNPDIFFGGYQAFLQLLIALVTAGYKVGLYLTAVDVTIVRYYIHHHPTSVVTKLLPQIKLYSPRGTIPFVVSPNDVFVAYSAWHALRANHYSQQLGRRFIYFIQEFEAAFSASNSTRFLVESTYTLSHYAIFNSENLKDYFQREKIGVFAHQDIKPHYTFEHVLSARSSEVRELSPNRKKRLIFYARPEGHAERNLFEIGILALRMAVAAGHYSNWEFQGFGALTALPDIKLGNNAVMTIEAKLAPAAYYDLLASADVGLSLIFTPHPGLVHFEMVRAGAITVVNTLPHRPAAYFEEISARFVPVAPTLDALVAGLVLAATRSDEQELRTSVEQKAPEKSWSEVFSKEVLSAVIYLTRIE